MTLGLILATASIGCYFKSGPRHHWELTARSLEDPNQSINLFAKEKTNEMGIVQTWSKNTAPYQEDQSLTKQEAQLRSAHITQTTYDVSIALPKGHTYFGRVTIQFNFKEMQNEELLFIDYLGTKIQNFIINGKKIHDLDNTEYTMNSRIPLDH